MAENKNMSIEVTMCPNPECQMVHMSIENHDDFPGKTIRLKLTDHEWDWLFTQVSQLRLSRPNAKPN